MMMTHTWQGGRLPISPFAAFLAAHACERRHQSVRRNEVDKVPASLDIWSRLMLMHNTMPTLLGIFLLLGCAALKYRRS
jgi:hypothetical protein